jgi:hypothetical protein
MTCLELLTKKLGTCCIDILRKKIFIALEKFVYLYQANFLKQLRMDEFCRIKLNILEEYYF